MDVSGRRSSRRSSRKTLRALESDAQEQHQHSSPSSRSSRKSSRASSPLVLSIKNKKSSLLLSGSSSHSAHSAHSSSSSKKKKKKKSSSSLSSSKSSVSRPSGSQAGVSSSRGYNPELVNYKDSEYHYGSDFEEDDEYPEEDGELEEDDPDSKADSEDSEFLSSLSSTEECDVEISPEEPLLLLPSTPESLPLWLQEEESLPTLRLPDSSDDLPLAQGSLMEALALYEALSHFRLLLRLSPFRLEDFAWALASEEQSNLLSELHISLLKALLRSEEKEGFTYGPMDLKDSSQCTFYFVDSMTWPENLKAFLASSAGERPAFKEALQLMKKGGEYPFGEDFLQHRIRVLSLLLHPFLSTSSVRDYIASEGTPGIEDHCRSCHRLGDMVVCDVCGGTYHLTCLDPPLIDNPEEEDWTCLICRDDTLPGVLEGFTRSQEAARIRNEALGTDRAGNKYWFLCRRIFIEHNPHKNNKEAEGQEVSYFSFLSQFEEMMHALDPEVYETELCETLCNLRPEIERQMMLTEELTHELKDGSRSTYLELENEAIQNVQKKRQELRENLNKDTSSTENNNDEAEVANLPKPENESELKEEDVKMEQSDEAVKDEIKEDKEGQKEPADTSLARNRDLLEEQMAGELRMTRRTSHQLNSGMLYYKLGQEGSFRSYVNQYSTNPMALSKVQANEERDKKRYMSHKFSLTDASAFKWQGNLFGSRSLLISTVRQSLIHLESSIPNMFMHSNWSILRKPWIGAVNQSLSSRDFSRALTVLQCCMRPCVMLSVWSDMLGHTSLKRVASGTKEEKKRAEKREKKEIEEREERLRPYNNFVKYTLGVKHLIVKQKGEEYRSHGQHGWLWLSSHRVFKPSDARLLGLRAGPHRLAVKYTDTRDNSSKVVLMEPRGFEYLLKRQTELELKKKKNADEGDLSESSGKEAESSKIAVDTKKLEEALKNARLDRQVPPEDSLKDVVNVEQGLSNPTRALFPKVAKKASVIDDFLARRLQLKTIEEQSLSTETKKEEDELEDSEEEQDSRVKKDIRAAINKLKEEDPSQTISSSCYSPSCSSSRSSLTSSPAPCYSPSCPSLKSPLREAKAFYFSVASKEFEGKIPQSLLRAASFTSDSSAIGAFQILLKSLSKKSSLMKGGDDLDKEEEGDSRIYSSKNTSQKIYLKRVKNSGSDRKSSKIVKYPLAPHFFSKTRKARSILILSRHDAKHMARKAGTATAEGFNYSSRINNSVWPYPCPRPTFRTAWLYRTASLSSLHGIALQMRILWGCIRWDDLFAKPPQSAEGKHQVTTDISVVTTEILKQRCRGRFLEKNEFLVKRVIIPLDTPKTVVEVMPIRSGLRKRKRAESPQQSEPKIEEEWVDEALLELWEIRAFRERLEKEKVAAVTRSRTGTAIREPVKYDPGIAEKRERKNNENEMPNVDVPKSSPNTPTSVVNTPRLEVAIQKKQQQQLLLGSSNTVNNASSSPRPSTPSTPTIIRRVTNPDGTISLVKSTPPLKSSMETNSPAANNTPSRTPLTGSQTKKVFISRDGKIIGTQVVPMGKSAPTTTPANNQLTPKTPTQQQQPSTPATSSSSTTPTQQKVQIVRSSDGKIQVKGLLPGQQLVQMPDGKLQIFSQPPNSSSSSTPASLPSTPNSAVLHSSPAVTKAVEPKEPGKQQIVAQQLQPGSQIPPGMTVFMSNGKTYCIPKAATLAAQQQKAAAPSTPPPPPKKPALVISPSKATPPKPQPQQTVSVMSLGSNTVTIRGNQMIVSGPDQAQAQLIAKHLSSGTARLGNIGGKQVLIMTPPAAPVPPKAAELNTPPTLPSQVTSQQPTQGTAISPLKVSRENKTPVLSSPSKATEVTAQLIQTPQGPRIILQGIQGANLSRDQLLSIQQQVKTQLLKAQAEAKLENRVPPTKIAVILPPSIQERINQQKKQQINKLAEETIKTTMTSPPPPPPPQISLPPTQQPPQQIQPQISSPQGISSLPQASPVQQINQRALDMPVSVPTQEVVKEDDDIPEEHHEEQQQSVPDEPVPEEVPSSSGLEWETATQHNVEIQSSGGVDDKDDPAPLPEPCEEPILPPPMPLLDDKRVALITNKLSSMLFRQKEQLKKDIAKKRALQEKELQLSISKEIERLKSSLLRSGTTTYKRKKEDQEDVEEKSKYTTPLSGASSPPPSSRKRKRTSGSPPPAAAIQAGIIKKDKVYCICKTKYDATKFYVGCDTCNNWFHGNCVGITEEMSKTMTEYFCDECKSAKDNQEIYCLCRQPYDDLQFYIGCERCADWFHGRCVGILQVEADNIDEYICPRCDSNTSYNYANLKPLNEHDYEWVKKLLKQLMAHRNSWPFKEPVDPNDVPNYYTVVKEPMDLQTIELRVVQSQYSRLSDFVGDVMRIFENCRYFNQDNSQVLRCAESLENYFAQKLIAVREKVAPS